jgi:transcriptional regulator with XRE-family HTH domain
MNDTYPRRMEEGISPSDLRNMMLSVGSAMRKLRIQKGYKCAEYFAYEYQLNRSAYYGWENGKNISIKKLILVCEALDMSLLEFFQLVRLPERTRKKFQQKAS